MSEPENPYVSPTEQIRSSDGRVNLIPVAITLVVLCVAWIFLLSFSLMFMYKMLTSPHIEEAARMAFTYSVWYMGICVAYNLLLITGAFSMVRRGSYVWAMATAILAMVPFLSPFYVLGIPVGIWAVVVLRRPGVRESFRMA